MARIEKTVFISYRRADRWQALAVFKDLTQHGYDVFIDYDGIASGDFERAIVDNIRSRAHFVVVLTPAALERCADAGDWLRREIEVAIEAQRNIVPLMFDGFAFSAPVAVQRLQSSLAPLARCQALDVPGAYFDAAMERLRTRFLFMPVATVLEPASPHAQQVAREQHDAAAHAAQPADAAAEYERGEDCFYGRNGRAKDEVAAAECYRKAAARGHAAAQACLGSVYAKGRGGLPKDDAQAVAWFRKAADQGNARGQLNLGCMYEQGRGGLPKDDAQAVAWFRKAADQGNALGQANLGVMHEHGRGGLPKDDAQAVAWYRKAADQGGASGQANLGFMYEQGRGGLPKDDAQAVAWYRKAADQGDALGQANLGFMYEQGRGGLPKDDARAVSWYRKAAPQGDEYAQQALVRLGVE